MKDGACVFNHVWLFATLWTVLTKLLCSWDSPGKNTGIGYHFLLQGIFQTQGSNWGLLQLLPWQVDPFTTEPGGKPLSSLTRNQTHASWIGSAEFYPRSTRKVPWLQRATYARKKDMWKKLGIPSAESPQPVQGPTIKKSNCYYKILTFGRCSSHNIITVVID